jgi:hypothetical protein
MNLACNLRLWPLYTNLGMALSPAESANSHQIRCRSDTESANEVEQLVRHEVNLLELRGKCPVKPDRSVRL